MALRNLVTVSAFCGILTRHYGDETVPEADGAASRFGVCVMLPSDYVRLGFTAPDVVAQRRKWDEDLVSDKERVCLAADLVDTRSKKIHRITMLIEFLAFHHVERRKPVLDQATSCELGGITEDQAPRPR